MQTQSSERAAAIGGNISPKLVFTLAVEVAHQHSALAQKLPTVKLQLPMCFCTNKGAGTQLRETLSARTEANGLHSAKKEVEWWKCV